MFEKLAEDIAYMAQIKLAALAEQMEKTAKGYGHKLRKSIALQKQLRQVGQQAAGATGEQLAQLQAQGSSLANKINLNNIKLRDARNRAWKSKGRLGNNEGQDIQNFKALDAINNGALSRERQNWPGGLNQWNKMDFQQLRDGRSYMGGQIAPQNLESFAETTNRMAQPLRLQRNDNSNMFNFREPFTTSNPYDIIGAY